MQNSPSQVSSGNIAPTVMGPQRDTKDVLVLSGLALFLAVLIAAAWYYGQTGDQIKTAPATEEVENGNVSEILKKTSVLTAPATSMPDIIHADIYFEIGRKGLTDEGKAQLSAQADLLKEHQDYGVLIQGYTDQQGSASYNKQLGLKRAETVKTELLNAGVAEHRMKVVSLGEEGVLCIDNSDTCRHMNRRVHLEIRKIGQEHMAIPAAAAISLDPPGAASDTTAKTGQTDSPTDNLVPLNLEPSPGS